jgi:hypothetical protein
MRSIAVPPLPSPAGSEVTVELEMKGLDKAINAAKTSGQLCCYYLLGGTLLKKTAIQAD